MIAYRGGPMRTVVYACFSVPVGSFSAPLRAVPGLLCTAYEDAELTREV